MGGDPHAGGVGLLYDGLDLVEGELLGAGRVAVAEHPAGGADLDHLGAVLVQLADHLAALVGAVDHRIPPLLHRGREEGRVAVAAGRADGVGGGDDPRAHHIAGVDRLPEAHVVEVLGAHVAHRGEARLQGRLGVRRSDDRPEAVGELQPVVAAVERRGRQVDVHVDQAGQQRHARQVHPLGAGREVRGALLLDGLDPPVGDQHRRLFHIFAGGHVEQPVGGHDDRARLRSRRQRPDGYRRDHNARNPHAQPPTPRFPRRLSMAARR